MKNMKNNMILLSDFAPLTGFRYKEQTPGTSGEEFRDNILIPALREHDKIVIDMDTGIQNQSGIFPSFLEETFGGLARIKEWTLSDFKKHIKIQTSDQEYSSDIEHYVNICNR